MLEVGDRHSVFGVVHWEPRPLPVRHLLIEDEAFTQVVLFMMSELDVALALQQPWVSICNDSQGTSPDGPLGKEHPHPRAYGAFPRILRKYCGTKRS